MQDSLISLRFRTADSKLRMQTHLIYEWKDIDQAIDAVFTAGGSLTLAVKNEIKGNPGAYTPRESISILSLPGRYALTIFPGHDGNGLKEVRYLWQANSERVHGKEMVEDIEFDTRFLCHDINIAKEICSEFFAAREITEKINALTVDESVPLSS
ncbi:DUF6911 family protein [Cellvibrio mixtus]|uniref:DUF6911 family protein n=1 Tax=Cellvibrio mixtus TaxID=39650 RepID=UPI000587ECCF|nr:hypothetical protein [Cellvibrio mixtus]